MALVADRLGHATVPTSEALTKSYRDITVAGPFATCSSALSWLSSNTPDLAVLDTQLRDGSCRDLAVELRRRGIPFMVYSGATNTHMPELAGMPWVAKPALGKTLLDALKQAITLPERAA
jgi:DNA-binding response OmpR family regulator